MSVNVAVIVVDPGFKVKDSNDDRWSFNTGTLGHPIYKFATCTDGLFSCQRLTLEWPFSGGSNVSTVTCGLQEMALKKSSTCPFRNWSFLCRHLLSLVDVSVI